MKYHNGSNTVASATIRWFPNQECTLAIVSPQPDFTAMAAAKVIQEHWLSERRPENESRAPEIH
jgi:hypothetical protein